MNQWYQYWPNYFKDDWCDHLISLAKAMPVVEGRVGHGGDGIVVDKVMRRSKIRWLPRFDPQFSNLCGYMELLFNEANRNAFGFDMKVFHEIQFTEYHAEDEGTYNWHHDTAWVGKTLQRRKLSMVIQLSNPEDYDGGRFEMSGDDCPVPIDPEAIKPRGTVVVFPSFLRHRVTPVTRGTRYSLVSWMEGPYFR
jgi:PKHD-type hydroxylase